MKLFSQIKSERFFFCYPSIKNPHVAVPLSSKKMFLTGLKIHNVSASKNILIKSFIEKLYYVWKHLRINRLYSGYDLDLLLNGLQKRLNIIEGIYCSVYEGTSGSLNQKYTIQIMNAKANVIGIIKFPITEKSNSFIKNEYDILNRLNKEKYEYIEIPNQLEYFNYTTSTFLFENDVFRGSNSLKSSLDYLIVQASLELANKTTRNELVGYCRVIESSSNIDEFPIELKLMFTNYINELKSLKIPTVLTHGDFVIYNMKKRDDKLVLIDWEFSREGLPLFDLLHFVFQGLFLVEKLSIEKILIKIYNDIFLRQYLEALSLDQNLLSILLKAYLFDYLLFHSKVKEKFDWRDSQYYKGLIILEKQNCFY